MNAHYRYLCRLPKYPESKINRKAGKKIPASTFVAKFFAPWESTISSWDDAKKIVEKIVDNAGASRQMAWRGVVNADYPVHSSIYRWYVQENGRHPTELQLASVERKILNNAKTKWRFDNVPALEIFAQSQHLGGKSRLLDVTLNPYVALWFAAEEKNPDLDNSNSADGRLFAFDVTNRQIELNRFWRSRVIPWSDGTPDANSPLEQTMSEWRTSLPLLWRPPQYNERIFAQNAAFLVGGVPQYVAGSNARYRKAPGNANAGKGNWKISEVREVTSVGLSMSRLGTALRFGEQRKSTPTFTVLVSQSAKAEIRNRLRETMGLDYWTIYPDILGLANLGHVI